MPNKLFAALTFHASIFNDILLSYSFRFRLTQLFGDQLFLLVTKSLMTTFTILTLAEIATTTSAPTSLHTEA
jgi:hypothetical protein